MGSHGATTTTTYTENQTLQPVQGEWFYEGRDCYYDFQQYTEGASPNLTLTGAPGTNSLYGIYQASNNSKMFDRFAYPVSATWYYLPYCVQYYLGDENGFLRSTDKVYLLYSGSITPTATVDFNLMLEENIHQSGTFEAIILFVNFVNTTGTDDFTFLFNFNTVNQYALYFTSTSADVVTLKYWSGAAKLSTGITANLESYDEGGSPILYYGLFRLVFKYIFNSKADVYFYNTSIGVIPDNYLGHYSYTPYASATGSSYTAAKVTAKLPARAYELILIGGVDSLQLQSDYVEGSCINYVTKNLTTYNIENYFNIPIPQLNNEYVNPTISTIKIKSELEQEDFIDFLTNIHGNLAFEDNLRLTSTYQAIDSTTFDDDISTLGVNTRYRCKNLNEFNNTIYVEVTYIYTPYIPTFMDLFMLALPSVLILIVPSAAAAIKFGKNGFLLVFFLMTLILTATNTINPIGGILMMAIIITIFLKLMTQTKDEGTN